MAQTPLIIVTYRRAISRPWQKDGGQEMRGLKPSGAPIPFLPKNLSARKTEWFGRLPTRLLYVALAAAEAMLNLCLAQGSFRLVDAAASRRIHRTDF